MSTDLSIVKEWLAEVTKYHDGPPTETQKLIFREIMNAKLKALLQVGIKTGTMEQFNEMAVSTAKSTGFSFDQLTEDIYPVVLTHRLTK